jgi:transposase
MMSIMSTSSALPADTEVIDVQERISKTGDLDVRRALYEAAERHAADLTARAAAPRRISRT